MDIDQKLTYTKGNESQTVDLYSKEGLEMVSKLWTKLYAHYKLTHDIKWMGIPIIQLPNDLVIMQELLWTIKPDVLVECGIAHGGSMVFYSSLFELMGKGRVIGVDVDIREHNRIALEKHPMIGRIEMIEDSSISDNAISKIKGMIKPGETVLVTLDSNHSKEHVAKELELYSEIVTEGSYLVAMDGAQEWVWDMPNGKPEWKEDNPLKAIEEFISHRQDFVIDDNCTRLKVTSNPKGYLKKIKKK